MSEPRTIQEGDTIVACALWSLELATLSGASVAKCDYCGGSIVVSPSGQEIQRKRPEAQLACSPCVAVSSLAEEVPALVTPQAVDEIAARFGWTREEAQAKIKELLGDRSAGALTKDLTVKEERESHS